MTTTDITRLRKNMQKKTKSVACAHILFGDIVSTNIMQLFVLPPNSLITDAGVIIDTVANGAITVNYGVDGGTELGAAIDLHTAVGYKQVANVSTVTTLTGTITALTLNEGTPNTLNAGTVAITSGAGTVVKAPRILTSTGMNITAVFSAGPTAGEFHFIVEYTEYTLDNGMLTKFAS